jgi:hypothetical protein
VQLVFGDDVVIKALQIFVGEQLSGKEARPA